MAFGDLNDLGFIGGGPRMGTWSPEWEGTGAPDKWQDDRLLASAPTSFWMPEWSYGEGSSPRGMMSMPEADQFALKANELMNSGDPEAMARAGDLFNFSEKLKAEERSKEREMLINKAIGPRGGGKMSMGMAGDPDYKFGEIEAQGVTDQEAVVARQAGYNIYSEGEKAQVEEGKQKQQAESDKKLRTAYFTQARKSAGEALEKAIQENDPEQIHAMKKVIKELDRMMSGAPPKPGFWETIGNIFGGQGGGQGQPAPTVTEGPGDPWLADKLTGNSSGGQF